MKGQNTTSTEIDQLIDEHDQTMCPESWSMLLKQVAIISLIVFAAFLAAWIYG